MKKIIVNGKECEWSLHAITYEEVIELAELPENATASVTYRYPDPKDGRGILAPQSNAIVAVPGLVINAYVTGNA